VAVTLKKETAIETRKTSGMAHARIWNALIVLGSILIRPERIPCRCYVECLVVCNRVYVPLEDSSNRKV
jgi:hypothetical protein